MWVWDVFNTEQGIPHIMALAERLETGLSLSQNASLLALALNDYERRDPKWDKERAMDFIDEVFEGGYNDPDFVRLILHGLGRVAPMPELPDTGEDADSRSEEEKKSN